jgi:hypothetical protein
MAGLGPCRWPYAPGRTLALYVARLSLRSVEWWRGRLSPTPLRCPGCAAWLPLAISLPGALRAGLASSLQLAACGRGCRAAPVGSRHNHVVARKPVGPTALEAVSLLSASSPIIYPGVQSFKWKVLHNQKYGNHVIAYRLRL